MMADTRSSNVNPEVRATPTNDLRDDGSPRPVTPESPGQPASVTEPTLAELFTSLSNDFSELVRKEAELARAETVQTFQQGLRGVVTITVSALLAYAGLIIVLGGVAVLVGQALESLWLGAVIVGGVVLIIGLILYMMGRSALEDLTVTPDRTIQTLQNDAAWAKEKVNESV